MSDFPKRFADYFADQAIDLLNSEAELKKRKKLIEDIIDKNQEYTQNSICMCSNDKCLQLLDYTDKDGWPYDADWCLQCDDVFCAEHVEKHIKECKYCEESICIACMEDHINVLHYNGWDN